MPVLYKATRGSSVIEPINVDSITRDAAMIGKDRIPLRTKNVTLSPTKKLACQSALNMLSGKITDIEQAMDALAKDLDAARLEHCILAAEIALPSDE